MAAHVSVKRYNATMIARDGITVPMVDLTSAQLVAGLAGGKNRRGEIVPGGWDDATCPECGDHAAWCPDLSGALNSTTRGRAWVNAKRGE